MLSLRGHISGSKPTSVGRFSFPSIKAFIAKLSDILHRYELRQRVRDPEDEELLQKVLKKHPEVRSKTKGLAIVGFEVHPFKGGERCFYLCRDDGTREHFGFKKCVRNAARG